jgi:hypothetical protein
LTTEIVTYTGTSLSAGKQLANEIESEVLRVIANEISVSRGYAKLARLLVIFKFNEGWRETGHGSFNAYLLSLKEKYDRSSQALYHYVTVAERLLPSVGEEGLDRMGITKAIEIVKASRRAKKDVPKELIDAALLDSNGTAEIRALAFKVFEFDGQDLPRGKYLDLGGFYVDEEQYETFKEAYRISARKLNLPADMPDWQKKQKTFLFWAQEISGTYAAEVYGEEATPDAA